MGVIIKNIFKRTFIFILTIILITLSASCNFSEESTESVSTEISSVNHSESESISNTSDVIYSEEMEESSNEEAVDVEEMIQDAIKSTFNSEKLKYEFESAIEFSDDVTNLSCSLLKENNNIFSTCLLSSEDNVISQRNDCFIDGKAFLQDEILGNSSFNCDIKDFSNYIEKTLFYYKPLSCSTSIEYKEGVFHHNFTEQIINENFFLALTESLSIKKTIFENGNCFIECENGLLKSINGEISAIAIFNEEEYPFAATFTVSCSYDSSIEAFEPLDFKEFESMEAFNLSKSLYNLALSDAYELNSESRLYFTENGNKSFIDFSSNFATSFLSEHPLMSFEMFADGKNSHNFEQFISYGKEYSRAWTREEKKPEYTVSDADYKYSNLESINYCIPHPFSLSDAISYSVTETDAYYIVEYTYKTESAMEIIRSYCSYLNKYFNGIIELSDEFFQDTEYVVENAIGHATIRKNDYIIIEHSIDVSIVQNSNLSIRLITSQEVISLNEDVEIKSPNK